MSATKNCSPNPLHKGTRLWRRVLSLAFRRLGPAGSLTPCGGDGRQARGGLGAAFLLFTLLLTPIHAFAVNPDEVLADPALEQRARALSAELRCMVCQNQSIDDSNAELARDLRLLVRERLKNGDSDEAVIDYVVSRYGEFVLLNPRLRGETLLLWGAPIVLFLAGAAAMVLFVRKRGGKPTGTPLSEAEKAELEKALE